MRQAGWPNEKTRAFMNQALNLIAGEEHNGPVVAE